MPFDTKSVTIVVSCWHVHEIVSKKLLHDHVETTLVCVIIKAWLEVFSYSGRDASFQKASLCSDSMLLILNRAKNNSLVPYIRFSKDQRRFARDRRSHCECPWGLSSPMTN